MRYLLVAAPFLAGAPGAQAAEPSEQARQNFVCAGAAGIASQLLEKSDPAASRRLAQRAQLLAESGVQAEVGRRIPQGDAVAAMATFLQSRESFYRADPGRVPADLADCRAKGMVPAGPTVTVAQVAAAMGVSTPPAATPPSAAATRPPVRTVTSPPPRSAASPDAELRRMLVGPWGRMLTGGTDFISEMILATAMRRDGPQFTRKACPPAGLRGTGGMLSHEIWFEERAGGAFGIVRASGDPGKVTTSWTPLRFKNRPDADTFRYEFNRLIGPGIASTHVLMLKRMGPDRIIHMIETPGVKITGNDHWYGRCRKA